MKNLNQYINEKMGTRVRSEQVLHRAMNMLHKKLGGDELAEILYNKMNNEERNHVIGSLIDEYHINID